MCGKEDKKGQREARKKRISVYFNAIEGPEGRRRRTASEGAKRLALARAFFLVLVQRKDKRKSHEITPQNGITSEPCRNLF